MNDSTGKRKSFFPNNKIFYDLILIFIFIAVSLVLLFVYKATQTDGAYAEVFINGEKTGSYPLSEDIEIPIHTGEDGYNILIIKEGYASIKEASCPDKICANHKPVKANGETIVCLPNKVVIRISSQAPGGIDAEG